MVVLGDLLVICPWSDKILGDLKVPTVGEVVVIVSFSVRITEYQSLVRRQLDGNIFLATEALIHLHSRDSHEQLAETSD